MEDTHALTIVTSASLGVAGEIADQAHGGHAFTDYQQRKAANTLLRQQDDLALFKRYLASVPIAAGDFHCRAQPLQLVRAPAGWGLAQPRHATPLCLGRQDRQ